MYEVLFISLVMETYFNITFRLSTIVKGGQLFIKGGGNVFNIITCSVPLKFKIY
jgi:hypothetical protein